MEFGFSEEDQMSGKGKLPNFSYSSSSSPSSSSPPQRKISSQPAVPLGQIYHDSHNQNQQHHHQFGGSWLSNRYDPAEEEDTSRINETSTAATTTASSAAAAKLDLMDVNDVEEDGNNKAAESSSSLVVIEKEHMFDKVVTPSDVGKLNRLVIPKQHAERYFPLDSTTNEKGLLLNFEDRNGKSWRFRYSYWNSSQSYVMTKGWSRFVKEKKLDAGDIVSFQRGVGELGKDHLYIDWRRRPDAVPDYGASHQHHHHGHHGHFSSIPWSPLLMRPPTVPAVLPRDHLNLSNPNYRNNGYYNVVGGSGGSGSSYGYGYGNYSNNNHPYPSSAGSSFVYLRSSTPVAPQQVGMGMVQWQIGGGGGGATCGVVEPMVYESVPVVQGKAAAKRLRLFGVNMDCPITTDHQSDHDEFDKIISSTTTTALPHNSTSITLQQQPSPQLASHPQFRLYRGTPLPATMPSSSTQFLHKGKSSSSSSSMSLDLEI